MFWASWEPVIKRQQYRYIYICDHWYVLYVLVYCR
jgi:hypothetical protein